MTCSRSCLSDRPGYPTFHLFEHRPRPWNPKPPSPFTIPLPPEARRPRGLWPIRPRRLRGERAARKVTASPRVRKVRQRDGADRGRRVRILGHARRRSGRRVAAGEATANTQAMIETINAIIRAEHDRRRRPRLAGHDPQGVRLGLCLVLDGRSGGDTPWSSRSNRGGSTTSFSGSRAPRGSAKGRGSTAGPGGSATCSSSRTSASCAIAAAPRWPAGPGSRSGIALPVLRDGQVDRHHGLLRDGCRGGQPDPARRAADHRPACLGQDLEAGQAGRADPDQADGRERARST